MTFVDADTHPCAVTQTTIAVTEALDMSTVPATAALFESVATTCPRRVVIDLTRCPFADASAIAFLMRAHRRLQRDAGQLVVLSPRPLVMRVLRASRADEVLDIARPSGLPTSMHRQPPASQGPGDTVSAMARERHEESSRGYSTGCPR